MLPILISTVAWSCAALGLGTWFVPRACEGHLRTTLAGFAGLYVLAVLGLWAALIARIGDAFTVGALLAGLMGLVASRGRDLPHGKARWALLGVAVALAALGQLPGMYGDQGLYYLQAVEWLRSERSSLGIARLHSRLGFNSSWFAVAAMMETPWLRGRSSFVVGNLPVLFAASAVLAAPALLRQRGWSFGALMVAAAAVPICLACSTLASMAPDAVVWLLTYVIVAAWALALEPFEGSPELALAAGWLSVLAITVKLSAAPAVVSGALLLWNRRWWTRRRAVVFVAALALLIVPWLLRGLVTSGCLLYPVDRTCITSLPWAVSREDARLVEAWIASWARTPAARPEQVLGNGRWFLPWLHRNASNPAAIIPSVSLAVGIVAWCRARIPVGRAVWTPLLLAATGVAFWFLTAPDPRFGLGWTLSLGLAPVALAVSRAAQGSGPEVAAFRRRLAVVAVGGACALFLASNMWIPQLRGAGIWHLLRWPSLPVVETVDRMTIRGGPVNVPVQGDQCWRAPLPCAPDGTPGLSFRGPFELVPVRPAGAGHKPGREAR